MIFIWTPFSPNTSLIYSTSGPFLTNDAAIKSIFYFKPNSTISSSSFSVRVGRLQLHLVSSYYFSLQVLLSFDTEPIQNSLKYQIINK